MNDALKISCSAGGISSRSRASAAAASAGPGRGPIALILAPSPQAEPLKVVQAAAPELWYGSDRYGEEQGPTRGEKARPRAAALSSQQRRSRDLPASARHDEARRRSHRRLCEVRQHLHLVRTGLHPLSLLRQHGADRRWLAARSRAVGDSLRLPARLLVVPIPPPAASVPSGPRGRR